MLTGSSWPARGSRRYPNPISTGGEYCRRRRRRKQLHKIDEVVKNSTFTLSLFPDCFHTDKSSPSCVLYGAVCSLVTLMVKNLCRRLRRERLEEAWKVKHPLVAQNTSECVEHEKNVILSYISCFLYQIPSCLGYQCI